MPIAHYRTIRGAFRYAKEIKGKFPSVTTAACQHPTEFGWAVKVTLPNSKFAYADRRPRNYTRPGNPQHRIASTGLEKQGE